MNSKPRAPVDALMDTVEWREVEMPVVQVGELYATHEGELTIFGHTLKVHVLNNGQRVIDAESVEEFFGCD